MVRRVTRILLFGFVAFGLITTASFWYGDKGAAVPKYQTHGAAAAAEEDPVLNFKVSERSIKEVRNSTLGVCASPTRTSTHLY